MNNALKSLLIVLAIICIVSPIDFMPEPVDDLIVLLLTIASSKASKAIN